MAHDTNILVIMADEFARNALGCAGHPVLKTPHLDQLARRGARFTQAYTNSPICVPARSSFATGLYVHQSGGWDSAQPYTGTPPGWAHQMRARGGDVASVGKLHFRSISDDNGFRQELVPMHVKDGVGWLPGLLRVPASTFPAAAELAANVGAGETSYTRFDRAVRDRACRWLTDRVDGVGPWTLFVSFVCPHYPFIAPEQYFKLYSTNRIPWPVAYDVTDRPDHPAVRAILDFFNYDDYFNESTVLQARAAYFGLVTYVDTLIGDVLDTLRSHGMEQNTLVIFTSDHGEMLGDHGAWTKQLMYEGSVGVPMIMAGPGVTAGSVVDTPCSLVDVYPTILEVASDGAAVPPGGYPGQSLVGIANRPPAPERCVFSEYHDGGSVTASFMLRRGRFKYIHHHGYRPQLYDLIGDPDETVDQATGSAHADICRQLDQVLREIVHPAEVNTRAFAAQRSLIES